jgi:phosphoglycerol transferase MdoB-like AlkP superfamily enzyme
LYKEKLKFNPAKIGNLSEMDSIMIDSLYLQTYMKSIYRPKNYTRFSYFFSLIKRLSLVLFFLLLSRLAFYLYNQYLFPGVEWENMLVIFRGGIRFDLSALFYLNTIYLVLALLPFPFIFSILYQHFLKILFVLFNAAGFFFQLFDFIFFRTRLRRIDFTFFSEFTADVNLGHIFLEGLRQYVLFFFLWVLLVIGIWFLYGRVKYLSRPPFTFRFFTLRTIVLCLVLLTGVAAIRGGTDRTTRPITLGNAAAYVSRPMEAAIVLNTPFCIIRTLGKSDVEKLDFFSDREAMSGIYSPVHRNDSMPIIPEEEAARKNVVILILESFSREYIGYLNPPDMQTFTPFLDSLMSQSLTCSLAYANGRKSVDAIPSVLGSIPSLEQSFALTPYALNSVEGLGNALMKAGYHTSFFHGASEGSMGLDGMSRHFGFDHYYGKEAFSDNSKFDGYWGIWDEPFLQFFAHTLNSFPQPFASAVFTISSHHPFVIPREYEGVFSEGTLPVHRCIGYADHALKCFFETVKDMSWYSNTLFVVVADHGTFSLIHPNYQTDIESMAIPVVYHDPSGIIAEKGLMYDRYTQQIDIMPTLLDMLDYPFSFFAFGRSILDTLTTPFVVNYPSGWNILRDEKEKEPSNELFLKAFRQQYNNRLVEDRLTVAD